MKALFNFKLLDEDGRIVTKKKGTLREIKEELQIWEDKYE